MLSSILGCANSWSTHPSKPGSKRGEHEGSHWNWTCNMFQLAGNTLHVGFATEPKRPPATSHAYICMYWQYLLAQRYSVNIKCHWATFSHRDDELHELQLSCSCMASKAHLVTMLGTANAWQWRTQCSLLQWWWRFVPCISRIFGCMASKLCQPNAASRSEHTWYVMHCTGAAPLPGHAWFLMKSRADHWQQLKHAPHLNCKHLHSLHSFQLLALPFGS